MTDFFPAWLITYILKKKWTHESTTEDNKLTEGGWAMYKGCEFMRNAVYCTQPHQIILRFFCQKSYKQRWSWTAECYPGVTCWGRGEQLSQWWYQRQVRGMKQDCILIFVISDSIVSHEHIEGDSLLKSLRISSGWCPKHATAIRIDSVERRCSSSQWAAKKQRWLCTCACSCTVSHMSALWMCVFDLMHPVRYADVSASVPRYGTAHDYDGGDISTSEVNVHVHITHVSVWA